MKKITAITVMALFLGMGLSGCDQAKDLATETVEKVKKDVAAEIGKVSKAITGGEQKEDGDSGKESEKQEDEKQNEGDKQ